MKLPSFLCIGAQKAGTSWLDKMLRQHPEVWLPPKKELHYFDCRFFDDHKKWDVPATRRVLMERAESAKNKDDMEQYNELLDLVETHSYSEGWYKKVFSMSSVNQYSITGDITPEYCMLPNEGIEEIKNLLGEVKIIYIIRDPVDRAWSQVKMRIKRRKINVDNIRWEEMLTNKDILSRGNYKEYVPKWDRAFGNNILFIPFGWIKNCPDFLLEEVESFLGLSHHDYVDPRKVVHKNEQAVNKPKDKFHILEHYVEDQRNFLKSYFNPSFYDAIK